LDDAQQVTAAEEVEARRRGIGEVDLILLDVVVGPPSAGVLPQELRPGILGLSLEQDVAMEAAFFRQRVGQRSAQHDRFAASPEPLRVRINTGVLKVVSGDTDDLGAGVVINSLACVFITERDAVLPRCERRQRQ
jgi:hypothetical protein